MLVNGVPGRACRVVPRVRCLVRGHRRVYRGGGCGASAIEHEQNDHRGAPADHGFRLRRAGANRKPVPRGRSPRMPGS